MDARTQATNGIDLTAEVDLRPQPLRTDLHDPRRRAQVEQALASVPGVLGARIVPGFEREVDELHVLTDLDRNPKQTVRDVQTVLMARFGVSTDHRVVSVVQLAESDTHVRVPDRVVIDRVGIIQSGMAVTAEVVLRDGEELLRGSADGAASTSARMRAVAMATLAACSPLLGGTLAELDGVDVVDVRGQQVAISVVHLRTPRSEQTLSGSAVVRADAPDAIARSVLDALNRTIEQDAR